MKQPLPDSISQIIKKKAEEYCDNNKSNVEGVYNYSIQSVNQAYASGYQDAIEFMLKFVEWVNYNYVFDEMDDERRYRNVVTNDRQDEDSRYTTEQLLSKFINSLTDKKD